MEVSGQLHNPASLPPWKEPLVYIEPKLSSPDKFLCRIPMPKLTKTSIFGSEIYGLTDG
jgi:hypothetical protein